MTTNDIRELEYQTDNIAILRPDFKDALIQDSLIQAAKLRGQSKITAGFAVANVIGDFTLTPPSDQQREDL